MHNMQKVSFLKRSHRLDLAPLLITITKLVAERASRAKVCGHLGKI
ncbi:hypothetical protein [Gloeocapsopsis dulcis]|nr:hypothetical protein [Gloeocapsopsis dulcis]WNN89124.1 hypothetical protein P0S91_23220 [Gloeocapsopsis dulcis]